MNNGWQILKTHSSKNTKNPKRLNLNPKALNMALVRLGL